MNRLPKQNRVSTHKKTLKKNTNKTTKAKTKTKTKTETRTKTKHAKHAKPNVQRKRTHAKPKTRTNDHAHPGALLPGERDWHRDPCPSVRGHGGNPRGGAIVGRSGPDDDNYNGYTIHFV